MKPIKEISINDKEKVDIKVGDFLFYKYQLHESVGIWASYKIDNENVVMFAENNVEYHYPERVKDPEITGADSAIGSFYFKAIAKGETSITINHEYRYEIEETKIIKVKVT